MTDDDAVSSSSSSSSSSDRRRRRRNINNNKRIEERKNARMEAAEVLDLLRADRCDLDAFHLLGVVTDPRVFSATEDHHHHPNASTLTSSLFNAMLDDLYSQLIMSGGEETSAATTTITTTAAGSSGGEPTTANSTVPLELTSIDTRSIEAYLATSGTVASAFEEIVKTSTSTTTTGTTTAATTTISLLSTERGAGVVDDGDGDADTKMLLAVSIPDCFFDPAFDLTHPATFQRMLLLEDNTAASNSSSSKMMMTTTTTHNNMTTVTNQNNDDGPVSTWLGLRSPDALQSYLDAVETALLHQVRRNGGNFFAESQRFADLQGNIQSLLDAVVEQSVVVDQLDEHYAPAQTNVTAADALRQKLHQLDDVLQLVEDLYLCKHGLGGVLAASSSVLLHHVGSSHDDDDGHNNETDTDEEHDDDASVIAQIRYAHRLLSQVPNLDAAFAIRDQLVQYEQLVIHNLRDELLELFLCTSSSSSSSNHNNNHGRSNGSGGGWDVRRAKDLLKALRQLRALDTVATAYSARVQDTIRMTVRTVVAEFGSSNETTTTTIPTVLVANVPTAHPSVASGVHAMNMTRFLDCLDLLLEQVMELLTSIQRVDAFFAAEFAPSSSSPIEDDEDNEDAMMMPSQQQPQLQQQPAPSPLAVATMISSVLVAAAELSSKSISELLRVRKDAHSLLTLDEMKQVWGRCTTFCEQVETILHGSSSSSGGSSSGGNAATSSVFANLRSTLLAQSKAFLERRHETNMAALAAALDSERWVQCEVSAERQDAMTRLSTGRTVPQHSPFKRISTNGEASSLPLSSSLPVPAAIVINSGSTNNNNTAKASELEVNGYRYKVVWSCLLLLEMVSSNLATSAFFPNLATNCVAKIAELLRLFNGRTTQLVLGAGAMHSHAKLKSINAKHLSLVTQCLGLVLELLPHVRGTLLAQLPNKQQHTLLASLDQVRVEYGEHNEKVLNKLVSIIGGLVERGLSKRIPGTDFDERAKLIETSLTCCPFLDEVASHTRRMHQVIRALLHPDHLIDTFSKIFAFLDTKVPALIIAAAVDRQQVFQRQDTNRTPTVTAGAATAGPAVLFSFPRTDAGKRRLLLEVLELTKQLNALDGVRPWDFTAVQILEKALEYSLDDENNNIERKSPSLAGSEDLAYCGSSSDGEERSEAPVDSGTDDNTVENGRSSREVNGHANADGMASSTEKKEDVAVDSDGGCGEEALEGAIIRPSSSLLAPNSDDADAES